MLIYGRFILFCIIGEGIGIRKNVSKIIKSKKIALLEFYIWVKLIDGNIMISDCHFKLFVNI